MRRVQYAIITFDILAHLTRIHDFEMACLDKIGPVYKCYTSTVSHGGSAWWRHQMETLSALLAICVGNSLVPGEFPTQRPVMCSFGVFFHLRSNKRLSKQWWGWWFETPSFAHYDVTVMDRRKLRIPFRIYWELFILSLYLIKIKLVTWEIKQKHITSSWTRDRDVINCVMLSICTPNYIGWRIDLGPYHERFSIVI